jgi:hypothetical protein
MPFTAGHPAAVLPFVRYGMPAAALVIGAITPDLPMMLPFPPVVHFAHTPLGLVTLDLILGTFAFVLWQLLFGPALVALAPRVLSARLPGDVPKGVSFHFAPGKRAVRVFAAVLIGAATHLLWDGITHDWMWGPQHIPWLASRHGSLLGWQWMQRLSDIVAPTILVAWVVGWWRGAPVRTEGTVLPLRIRVLAWSAILGPAAAGFLYGLLTDSLFVAFARGAGLGAAGLAAVTAMWWAATRRAAAAGELHPASRRHG